MLTRAYSTFTVKSFDDAQRIIEGIATTPEPDRAGDILESTGATFTLPLPLLWQHDRSTPIGRVLAVKVTPKGLNVRAQLEPPGTLPEIDKAWTLIKAGLVRGLSPGVKINTAEPINARDPFAGIRVKSWEMVELSAVTIPANKAATIQLVKSLYGVEAPLGQVPAPDPLVPPAAVGVSHKGRTPMQAVAISEQIVTLNKELSTKAARLETLVTLESASGALEPTDLVERDTLTKEINGLSGRVTSLRSLEAAYAAQAVPVVAKAAPIDTVAHPRMVIEGPTPPKVEPGIGLARAVMCQMASLRARRSPLEIAKAWYPEHPQLHLFLREDVPAASTLDNVYMGPLVYPTNIVSEFIEFLRPQTIVGRIDSFSRVPFNVRITGESSGATGYWVGQGKAKPLTSFATNAITLGFYKVANIIAMTEELARFSSPSAEARVRKQLADACRERIDRDFVDPDKALQAGVSPKSITNGITNLNASGTNLAAVDTDVNAMMQAFANALVTPTHWIMPNTVALSLSLMRTSQGARAFPDINMNGGTFMGLPVVTSQYCLNGTPANNVVILLAAPEIFLADDGDFRIDVSNQASLEMNDAPTMDAGSLGSPAGATGSRVVSMFQTNSIAVRCERFINWARARETAVVWMDDVQWAPS